MRNDILDKVKQLEKLPTLPEVIYKVLSFKGKEDISLKEIEGIINRDPSLSAKLIRVANTVFFNPYGTPVTGLRRAIELLGTNNLFSIVLSIVLTELFPIQRDSPYRDLFWKHSFVCAFVSKHFSKFLPDVDEDTAFAAGLLHDIGKLVFYAYFNDKYDEVLDAIERGLSSYLAEFRVFSVSHDEVGATLLDAWGIPRVIVDAVRYHHTLGGSKGFTDLTALVHIANTLTMLSDYSYYRGVFIVELSENPAWLRVKRYIEDADYEIHKVFDDVTYAVDMAEIIWGERL